MEDNVLLPLYWFSLKWIICIWLNSMSVFVFIVVHNCYGICFLLLSPGCQCLIHLISGGSTQYRTTSLLSFHFMAWRWCLGQAVFPPTFSFPENACFGNSSVGHHCAHSLCLACPQIIKNFELENHQSMYMICPLFFICWHRLSTTLTAVL
jgi:hypothetical protein